MFSALLEYALVNYASRSDATRLAKKKIKKQWELDRCSFDPEHFDDIPGHGPPPGIGISSGLGPGNHPGMVGIPGPRPNAPPEQPDQSNNGGGSFAMVI